jgi:hypothetical protein
MDLTTGGLIGIILSSSVLSALLSAIASHLLSGREYKRDYHREVVRRRLDAYEHVQHVIRLLRRVVYQDDGRTAHMAFASGSEGVIELMGLTLLAEDLWLDPPIRDLLVAINRELQKVPTHGSRDDIFRTGEKLRVPLAELRLALEAATCESLRDLHNIDLFLLRKRAEAAKGSQFRLEELPIHHEDRSPPGEAGR